MRHILRLAVCVLLLTTTANAAVCPGAPGSKQFSYGISPLACSPVATNPFVSAGISTTNTQSITQNTRTPVSFNTGTGGTVVWNDSSLYANANPTRFTASVSGRYRAAGNACFANASDTSDRDIWISVNGTLTTGAGTIVITAVNGDVTCIGTSAKFVLNAGDYLELVVFQTSTGAVSLQSVESHSAEFNITQE